MGTGDPGQKWVHIIESSKSSAAAGGPRGASLGAREPLLPATSADSPGNGPGVDSGVSHQRSRGLASEAIMRLQPAGRGSTPDAQRLFSALRQKSVSGAVGEERQRTFLTRLATALHAYGSSAARTEYLVQKAAERLEVDLSITVFPSTILLSFGDAKSHSAKRETVLLTVSQDLDVDKLGRVDELARSVGLDKHLILVAYWQLRAIANSAPTFGLACRLTAFAMMAASAAPLFYGGSFRDAIVGGLLGLAGGLIELWAATYSPVAVSVIEFLTAVFASFIARAIISFTGDNTICFYPTVLAALVWFLPGLSLTLGVNELVAKTFVAGSSHIMAAIFSAFQLGFGVSMGKDLVAWDRTPLSSDCSAHVIPPPLWAKGIWFAIYVLASNVLLNARWGQWPGMCLVTLVGYIVSDLTLPLGDEASSIIAAFAISVSGTLYSRVRTEFPLAMKTAGILVLVPGGLGVSGVASLLQDSSVGTLLVFEMLMVALAITLGLLVGKIFFPEALFGYSGRAALDKHSVAESLRRESIIDGLGPIEEEEGMAI